MVDLENVPACCRDCLSFDFYRGYGSCDLGRILPTKKQTCDVSLYLKKHRGGNRPGAGRPKSDNPKIKWSGYLSSDVIDFLKKSNLSQGQMIDASVRLYMSLQVFGG